MSAFDFDVIADTNQARRRPPQPVPAKPVTPAPQPERTDKAA